MQVKVADHSGFCFGVRRAIGVAEDVLTSANKNKKIYSFGAIIHNPQVVEALSKKGLSVIKDANTIKDGVVIISSHGATREIIDRLKKKKIKLIDATCPFVKYAHDIVKDLKKKGYQVVIIGDKEHPEVKALNSLAREAVGKKRVTKKKIGIISQTTQNKEGYIKKANDLLLKGDFSEARIFNTICSDTAHRQESCRRLLKECDVMIVVGGKNSANTRRLCGICKESGVDTYHIEVDSELKKNWFNRKIRVGVVSGASTPKEMVNSVVNQIETIVG
ncbi:MAG: 4-hydroxy-3-methylbut-2-enyl diphosphate reductase [Candidatus Omnitrophota bacterium]|jgi:4-hydroxy-3-methylbut-2-enyl diphosphate reductase|nr:4-hydroxy-3-methylbut-2-enyl diphosphate reductase [Candidatus Omnitrophota bacterium]